MNQSQALAARDKLMRNWDVIDSVLRLARGDERHWEDWWGSRVLHSPISEESQRDIARRWSSILKDEIETVWLARNALAHGQPMDQQSVMEASRLSDELLTILEKGLVNPPARPAAAG